jgi:ferredoxin
LIRRLELDWAVRHPSKVMTTSRRKIVTIDEEKCNGCGLCVPACLEGALQIVDGKARLVADIYCDGLGACLGECPQNAITIIEREADAFDEEAARRQASNLLAAGCPAEAEQVSTRAACPGSMAAEIQRDRIELQPAATAETPWAEGSSAMAAPSRLGNWPVQLHLVPPDAPFLKKADLLLVADCVPFALADFHRRFLGRRPVVIGCPKLDDAGLYVEKLARIVATAEINSITVVHMEVPCCAGLVRIAQSALRNCQRQIPLEDVTISIRGRILSPGLPK